MGMHSSRRLQFEHATFMLCGSNGSVVPDGISFRLGAGTGVSFIAIGSSDLNQIVPALAGTDLMNVKHGSRGGLHSIGNS
jgi:hypothetical protein